MYFYIEVHWIFNIYNKYGENGLLKVSKFPKLCSGRVAGTFDKHLC